MSEERYDKWYTHGNVRFYLEEFLPDVDQWRFLILKVLEQAVRDYCSLVDATTPSEKGIWQNARDFLYYEEYLIQWGDLELSTRELLDVVDIDIDWVREQTTKRFERGKDNG